MAHELAQVNVARLRAPLDAPQMRDFTAALDPVNQLAEGSDGFVWRLAGDGGHALTARPDRAGALLAVNLSVWTSYEALHAFVYRSAHGAYVKRRRRWFLPAPQPATALWWVPGGTRPDVDEALRRLEVLRRYGPSPRAFGLLNQFDAAGRRVPRRAASRLT